MEEPPPEENSGLLSEIARNIPIAVKVAKDNPTSNNTTKDPSRPRPSSFGDSEFQVRNWYLKLNKAYQLHILKKFLDWDY